MTVVVHKLLARVSEWPLITQKTARDREENAFAIGVDAGRAIGDLAVTAHLDSTQRRQQDRP